METTRNYGIAKWVEGVNCDMQLINEGQKFGTKDFAEEKLAELLFEHYKCLYKENWEDGIEFMLKYAEYDYAMAKEHVPTFLEESFGEHPANGVWGKWYDAQYEYPQLIWYVFPNQINNYNHNGVHYQVIEITAN